MDFRRLSGSSFRVWVYLCSVCKKREGGLAKINNRFLEAGHTQEVANLLGYNIQTVSQAFHLLREAGFLTDLYDVADHRKFAHFLHVIRMGEYVEMPTDAEKIARGLFLVPQDAASAVHEVA